MPIIDVFGERAAVEDGIAETSRPRVDLTRFRSGGPPIISIHAHSGDPLPHFLGGDASIDGRYAVGGSEILVQDLRTAHAAEAALKLLFQVVAVRSRGLLFHAASIEIDGHGVLIVGPSGAGKSTLARMCQSAGAMLLTDETTGVIGGKLYGTPFKSDDDLVGENAFTTLAAILVLEKGDHERFERVVEYDATSLLLSQVYRPPPGEVSSTDLLRRASALAASPGIHRFTFRKNLDAVSSLRAWLADVHRG